MKELHVKRKDSQYDYLKQQADKRHVSLESLLSDLIGAEIRWQQTLAEDPLRDLIGAVEDDFDTQNIDDTLYPLPLAAP